VVGRIDYFLHKIVVKLLELTWNTFHAVVNTISLADNYAAYRPKENDQTVNKVELVDIDLHTQKRYGNTWFTNNASDAKSPTTGAETNRLFALYARQAEQLATRGAQVIVLPEKIVQRLWDDIEDDPGTEVTVDLSEQTVQAKDLTVGFVIDCYTRWRLLEGLDDIALSLQHSREIDAFEARRRSWLPTTTVG